ncbi:hypothetical protein RJ640_023521 [Escallonia rubra]|uniref:Uncharacterized protein n=1 Tax=Escallonia rubra TaxID=112253 RepID=A0AA88UCJ8_9ASTE|nr:hypothetical protein RJ640_023521 [Escallonia rubra]
MVSTPMENLVTDLKLSSVVPARITGEDKFHELTNMDLAMKLHYLRGVYFFKSEAVQGLDIFDFKKSMFPWLDLYKPSSGRIRRSEKGRPLIKCNDGGVRIVEAQCIAFTVNEWLAMEDGHSLNHLLTYNHVLGPDLGFSPLVFVQTMQRPFNTDKFLFQFTRFKCGGLSVGLSWAHILGDAFSASAFINLWGDIAAGHFPTQPLNTPDTGKLQFPSPEKPFSMKKVDPVGDYWLATNSCKMGTHSIHLQAEQLDHLLSKSCGISQTAKLLPFEVLSAIMWKSLAKIRGTSEPRVVTICTNSSRERERETPSNSQVVSTVAVGADFAVAKADLLQLAKMISKQRVDEGSMIEGLMERENGNSDFIVYGANLTFVNLQEARTYGLELNGQKPISANYSIDGVGEEGVVLVLPGHDDRGGRTLSVVLPQYQVEELREELKREWDMV